MSLNSLPFLACLPVLWIIFRLVNPSARWMVLLLFSLLFIGVYRPWALLVVCEASFFTFYAARLLNGKQYRKLILLSALGIQILALLLLKYVESADSGLRFLFRESGFRTDTVFYTLGFSFYTLQHIGYLLDVYYKRIPAESHPLRFLLFSAYFAKFNAGPLEQPAELIPQFKMPNPIRDDISAGFQRIVLGLFKKMVLADHLAPVEERIFNGTAHPGSLAIITGVILFTIQLYFDFSAYCDLAIGVSRMFGIRLTENFLFPFSSESISVFWRTWHITLIKWFTTYIYYPLVYTFRKSGRVAVICGIACTFLLSGIWHGIGYTFLVWSLLHALYLSFESLSKHTRVAWSGRFTGWGYKWLSMLITFMLVCFSNLFFRAENWTQAIQLLKGSGGSLFGREGIVKGYLSPLAGGGYQEALFNLGLVMTLSFAFLVLEKGICKRINSPKLYSFQLFILLFLILFVGVFQKTDSFIYLQF
ncbi:MAG: MBOAT family O-acyltransferase [Bacteroidia bacterium]